MKMYKIIMQPLDVIWDVEYDMKYYTADFETTTDPQDCRVWSWGCCEVGKTDTYIEGNTIEEFLEWCNNLTGNATIYFHNLKFDGEFLLSYWLHNHYKMIDKGKTAKGQIKSAINDMGAFYGLTMLNKSHKMVHFWDSLKLLPFTVKKIAKSFNLEYQKLEIDYEKYRPIGYIPTEQEREYVKHDVLIMAIALQHMFDMGLCKMTIGANAMDQYKKMITREQFGRLFPICAYDNEVRQSYKGGFTYLKKGLADRDIGKGLVLDVNSLYPWVLSECPLPYGEGKFFKGKYEADKLYPLYIQMMRCAFRIKEGKIPTVQLKGNFHFAQNVYVESTVDDYRTGKENDDETGEEQGFVTMCLTSVDLQLFLEHYDIIGGMEAIEWLGGWKFRQSTNLFKDYIDYWNEVKVKATIEHDPVKRQIAKLMLNNLYGKFATNPTRQNKLPYLKEDGSVGYELLPKETKDGVYIPVGSFVTAWARDKTIRSAQSVYDRFIYADTDSLHLIGWEIPENLDISGTELGKWKIESRFSRARFIKQKTYIEQEVIPLKISRKSGKKYKVKKPGKESPYLKKALKVTAASMPDDVKKLVTWENFHPGTTWEKAKLKPKHVKGGIVLEPTPHTIK